MSLVTVYRMENAQGEGPYRARHPVYDLCDAHSYVPDTHPCPQREGIEIGWGRVCGCASLEQLNTWFNGWIDKLLEGGYRVVAYRVPVADVSFGKRQLAFSKAHAMKMDVEEQISVAA